MTLIPSERPDQANFPSFLALRCREHLFVEPTLPGVGAGRARLSTSARSISFFGLELGSEIRSSARSGSPEVRS
jgi:hypothetical protein